MNHNSTSTGSGSSTSSNSAGSVTGSTTTNAEVKTETPDEELKSRPLLLGTCARMPVFLSRNAKRRKKHGEADRRTVSVTVDGKLVTMAELQSGGSELAREDTVGEAKSKQATTAGHNSHSSCSNIAMEGNDACLQKENDRVTDRGASSSNSRSPPGKSPPQHDEGGGANSPAATNAKAEPTKAGSKTPNTAKDNGSSNNNNPHNINNNNSISSSGNKQAATGEDNSNNPSLWFGSGNSLKPQATPSSTVPSAEQHRRRLPSVNGAADRNLPYKTAQGQKKNFTMYRQGSLTRSRKSHCRVTTRMGQRFRRVVDRWLDQHVSGSQRVSCVDWLLGKRQDLLKTTTTSVIVQDNGLSRTPYAPYNRYKVKQTELDKL